ncbi:MAG: hypothetical protein ACYSW6_08875 [Planctomycetota bacterium]|jgi:hypothetical protein
MKRGRFIRSQRSVHPVTEAVVKELKATRQALREALGEGKYLDQESSQFTSMSYARAVGNIDGLDEFLNVEFVEEGDEE